MKRCSPEEPGDSKQKHPSLSDPFYADQWPERTNVVTVFALCQDAPVQTQVRQALARPRLAHALRPSAASSQRIIGDLRSTKWSTRREERYRILSSHRTALSGSAEIQNPQTDHPQRSGGMENGQDQAKCSGVCEIQVVDLIHEDAQDQDKSLGKVSGQQAV